MSSFQDLGRSQKKLQKKYQLTILLLLFILCSKPYISYGSQLNFEF